MRPVSKEFPMIFGFKKPYSPTLQAATGLSSHWGQDFACPIGTPIIAGIDGYWLGAGWHRGYGYMAEIIFSTGRLWWKKWYLARYAHLIANSACPLRLGAAISKADEIALSGDTGATLYADKAGKPPRRHPHLHFELWKARKVAGAWLRIELADPALITGEIA